MHPAEGSPTTLRVIPPAVQRALLRLPPLSRAAAGLHRIDEEKADLRDIAALIGTDPALATAVLRLVNSPLFGVRQEISGILQAVALLGLDRLRALVTTAALRMLVRSATATPALTRCWRHSVACALTTQDMTLSICFDRDVAYTAGLLHDIGRFAMLSCWPKEYSHVLDTCQPAEQIEVEFETLGVSHADAGAFLLQRWGLPSTLVEAAREHHCQPWGGQPGIAELVSRGCNVADALGFTATAKSPDDEVPDDSAPSCATGQEALCFRIADGINQLEWM